MRMGALRSAVVGHSDSACSVGQVEQEKSVPPNCDTWLCAHRTWHEQERKAESSARAQPTNGLKVARVGLPKRSGEMCPVYPESASERFRYNPLHYLARDDMDA